MDEGSNAVRVRHLQTGPLLLSIVAINPTCSGGGHIVPALQKTGSHSSLFGLRDPKFWYNSYIIVTLDVHFGSEKLSGRGGGIL